VGVQHNSKNGNCRGGQQGYASLVSDGVDVTHAVDSTPAGAMFVRARGIGDDLPTGDDTTPSLFLIVSIGQSTGTFEIDTTCMIPNNHLMFAVNWPTPTPVTPAFTKGTVTVIPCICSHQGDVDTVSSPGVVDVFDCIGSAKIGHVRALR
jgi:hypothetical protein